MRKLTSRILILAGVIVIGVAIFLEVSTRYKQKKLINEYSEYVAIMKNIETNELKAEAVKIDTDTIENSNELPITEPNKNETATDSNSSQETAETDPPKNTEPDLTKVFEGKQISGLIEIPEIKVSAAILEGTDDSALQYSVGHYPGFGEIGQPGNYVLLGHRNYVYGHFFRNIDKLKVDDQINIKKDTETYIYSVTESFVVSPEDVWVLEQTEEPTITLITCTPIGTYTDRLIVKGVLLNNGE